MIEFPTESVALIARHYTREAGVRRLEQLIGDGVPQGRAPDRRGRDGEGGGDTGAGA